MPALTVSVRPASDAKAALIWARLMADGSKRGQPRSALDMIVASVAEANGGTVVTGNERGFAGLSVLNPMRVQPHPSAPVPTTAILV